MIKLKEIRKSKNMSQQLIAEILKIDQAQVSRIEKEQAYLNHKQIIQLCIALECTSDYLLGLIEDNEDYIIKNAK